MASLIFYLKGFLWTVLLASVVNRSLCQAPKLTFKHITAEQGLSNSTIEVIFQDSRGFMWFGTRDGLNRFDGYRMTVYRYNALDSTSISDNYITAITEDREHTIWVGTINGLNALDPAKNKFIRYKHQPGKPQSLSHNQVTAILEDRNGHLWVTTFGGGLNQLHKMQRSFSQFRHRDEGSLSDDRVNTLFEDAAGRLWMGTEKGIDFFSPEKEQFVSYQPNENSGVSNIGQDKQGNLWLGTKENGLLRFDPDKKTFSRYGHEQTVKNSLGTNQVRAVLIGKNGTLWVGGVNGGLNLFDTTQHSFFNYQNRPEDPFSLSQRTVSALFEDSQGNLWVGTHRGGINLYTPNTLKFPLFRQETDKNSISYNDIRTFCEDDNGSIWIGTDGGGLNLFDRRNSSFSRFLHNPYNKASICSNEILHTLKDSEGNLWISSWGGGLDLLKKGSKTFEHFISDPSDSTSLSSNYVQQTFEDRHHNLWVATYYGGLNLFDRKKNKFTHVIYAPDGKTRLLGNNMVSIEEDQKGNLWIGTDDNGLNRYDPLRKTFTHYFNNEDKVPDLRVLFTDSKGRFWAGQAGLYLFDEATDSFSPATTTGGLSTEFIKGITEDGAGNFWISTSNGLTEFNPQTKLYKKFNTADGLQGLEFEANACLRTKDGQLFFGGVNGFNCFYPEQVHINKFVPPVYLTDLQIFNEPVLPSAAGPLTTDISLAKEVRLSYLQSTISFAFAALNFSAAENNHYAYRLEGLQESWTYAGTEHKASYTNLDPGTYTFMVKASNNDGVWNEKGSTVRIIITPPFWKSWWFTILMILAFFAAVVAYYQFRRNLERKAMEEKKREEIRGMQLQFFTNISHEFRTPLSLILGPLEKLQREDHEPAFANYYNVMHRNANRLLALINELMDFRKAASGALKLNVMPGHLSLFLREIEEEFHELAAEKKMQFTVTVPENMAEAWFDRQVLEKIVINLLSNSFKYSANGGAVLVEVMESLSQYIPSFQNELHIENDYRARRSVYLRVIDSGIGISKESLPHLFERYYRITDTHMGSGVGLAFVKSLTLLHKGSIYVYSERHKGTEIIVSLPVDSHDYTPQEKWMRTVQENTTTQSSPSGYLPAYENSSSSAHAAAATQKNHQKQCILIVDDNPELKAFLTESLEPFYQVTGAKNGLEGLQKTKEMRPGLIISDVMMPVMDGIEFCQRVKEDPAVGHIPFVMLTAKDAAASRLEGTGSGADHYFSKPISIELLLLTIKNVFEQKQRLKERIINDHHIEAKDLVHAANDQSFMIDLLAVIDEQLTNPELDVALICKKMGMSRTKLYQKVKMITGQAINDFVRTIRLRKAVEIMTHEDVSMADVIFRIGIQTQSYFTKAFKKEFGKTPSQFLQDLKHNTMTEKREPH